VLGVGEGKGTTTFFGRLVVADGHVILLLKENYDWAQSLR